MKEEHLAILRRHMVEVVGIHADIASEETGRPVLDERVLAAMGRVPRHRFVPGFLAHVAYQDMPLPIGFHKTISQPFIVALMTDLLELRADDVVLEVGTGLGYGAAILAELSKQVWTVEVVEEFANAAEQRLAKLGYGNVGIRVGDGSKGWAEHAPFDRIIVASADERVPPMLLDQLMPGGRLVMPLGPEDAQRLTVVSKDRDGRISSQRLSPVRFTRLETVV